MCWTGSSSVVPTIVAGMRAWLDAAPEGATILSLSEEDGGGPGVDQVKQNKNTPLTAGCQGNFLSLENSSF